MKWAKKYICGKAIYIIFSGCCLREQQLKTVIRKGGKIMSAYFEYNFEELDNNGLRINGKSSYSDRWDSIIIKKEWIAWNNFAKR